MAEPGNYGTDLALEADASGFAADIALGPDASLVSGVLCVVLAIARRLDTAPGTLERHPEYGYLLRGLLRGEVTPSQLLAAQGDAAAQCEQDPRVRAASVALTFFDRRLRAAIHLVLEGGESVDLVLGLDAPDAVLTILRGPDHG